MDVEKLIEKALRWLSDPKARELLSNFFYLLVPLVVLLALRSRVRGSRPQAAQSTKPLKPTIRGSGISYSLTPETLEQTKAREQEKIRRELAELFGKKQRVLAQGGQRQAPGQATELQPRRGPAEEAARRQAPPEDLLGEELLKMFMRRKG